MISSVRLLAILLLAYLIGRLIRSIMTPKSPVMPKDEGQPESLKQCPVCKDYVQMGQGSCGKTGCPWMVLFLLAASFLFALPAMAAESGGRYLVEVSGQNVTADLDVNGIKAEHWQFEAKNAGAGASLNHWLKKGNNSLSFKVTSVARNARVSMRVYFMAVGSGPVPQIVDLVKSEDLARCQRGVSVNFNLPSAPQLKLWSAEAVSALSADQAAELVNRLRGEMASGEALETLPSLATEQEDMARAFGVALPHPLAPETKKQHSELQLSAPLAASDLVVSPLAQTGLVKISRKSGAPLLLRRVDGQSLAVPVLILGRVGGVWTILRQAY